MDKTFILNLNLKRSSSNRQIDVVEGDNGNVIDVTLTDDGAAVDLTGCKVLAVFAKSDGTTAQQDNAGHGITMEAQTNRFKIALYTSSFSPPHVTCEIQVIKNEVLVTTAQFNMTCRRSILNKDTVLSTSEYPILIDLIGRTEAVEAGLSTITATESGRVSAETARATAEKGREATESGRVAAENARVNAENSRSAVSAAHEAAEQTRQANENTRQAQEQTRQTDTTAAIVRTDTAISSTEAAKKRAIDAAILAEGIAIGKIPAHAATHAAGGTDQLSPADIGASPAVHTHAMGDITALGAALDAKAAKSTTLAAALTSAGWAGAAAPYVQTVNVAGVTAAMNPIVDVVSTAAADIAAWGCVSKIETGAGAITATCYESKPETSINITLLEVN